MKHQINKNNSIDKFLEDSCVSNVVENKNNNRCYVLFCDQKYYQYMKNVLTLLDEFSEYKVLAYTVNFLPTDHFKNVTFKRVNDDNLFEYQTTGKNYLIKDNWDKNMYMCFNKINIIIESLKTGFDEFVYLDVDTFPTQNINDIFEIARKGLDYPILPRYEHEIMIYGDRGNPIVEDGYDETKTLEWWLIEKLGLIGKYERTHYRQSCFFYYNKKCKSFWEECCKIISNDEIFKNQNEFFGDESIINVLLWERSGVEYFDGQHIKHVMDGDQFKTFEKVDDFFRELQNNDKLWLLHGKVYKYFFKELLLSDHQYDEVESEKINNYFVNKMFGNEKYKENLLGKVLINFDSKSLGDNIAWMPYAEEFRKKHNCKVVLSTFWNHLFEKEYPEIEFISPGTVVYNINGQYNIGWYFPWDTNKNPNDFRTISLQQTASDILGLEYKEIKPKITIP